MQCHYSFLIVFALLLLLKVSSIECQTPPYSLTITNRDVNQLTLQCMDEFGNPVSNAVFYRNGVLNTSDECFNSSVSIATNKLRFTIFPECEGYYMCGTRNGNSVVLSKPISIYAYPEHTSDYNATQQSLRVVAGTSITLPCHVQVSALDGYRVKWKIRDPVKDTYGERSESHNSDYSLTLTNLNDSKDSLIYNCQVESQIIHNGPYKTDGQKTRLYVIEYIPPSILQVSAQTGTDGLIELNSTATGSDLNFTWFLNNQQLHFSDEQVEYMYLRQSPQGKTGFLGLQLQTVNSNSQSKRLRVVVTNKDIHGNYQSASYEGWLLVNNANSNQTCKEFTLFKHEVTVFAIIVAILFILCCVLTVLLVIMCCRANKEKRNRAVIDSTIQQQPADRQREFIRDLQRSMHEHHGHCINITCCNNQEPVYVADGDNTETPDPLFEKFLKDNFPKTYKSASHEGKN